MRRGSLFAVACGVLGMVTSAYLADARADTVVATAIPAQSLDAALGEFAHQTGLQLVYLSQVTRLQASKGSRAGLSAPAALTELLEGTGLSFQFLNERTVRIFPTPPATPAESTVAAAAAKPGARHHPQPSPDVLDEVDVTARRSERELADYIQNVPVSVSMVTGDVLKQQKSEQLLDYAGSLPGMYVLTGGAPGQINTGIRGAISYSAPVAFYVDDVPLTGTGAIQHTGGFAGLNSLDFMPHDLARLELWRGPQGTSIGADAQIGLVRYVLIPPNISEVHVSAAADVFAVHGAETPGASIAAAVNLPVVAGRLGLRASVYDSYTPGYIDNLYTGAKGINALRWHGGRIASLWQPTEALSITVNALWDNIYAHNVSQVTYDKVVRVPDTGNAWFVMQDGSYGDLLDNHPLLSPESRNIQLYSLSLQWDSGLIGIHSATAWSSTDAYHAQDMTLVYGPNFPLFSGGIVPPGLALSTENVSLSKFSEELHVTSHTGRSIDWMLGAFYTRESSADNQAVFGFDESYRPISLFTPAGEFSSQPARFTEEVLFANATWHVTGRVDLDAGIRIAHDYQSFLAGSGAWDVPTGYVFGHASETDTTWSAAARYRFSPSAMLYARIATGFQPGLPNGFQPGVPPASGNTAVNYELGLKAEYLEAKALTNLSVFYVDWRNLQVFENSGPLVNGAEGTSKGLELTSSYAPLEDLQLAANAAYTESVLDKVIPAANYILTGYQTPGYPKWSLSATATRSWPLAGRWRAQFGGAVRWLGQQFTSSNGVTTQVQTGSAYPTVVTPAYSVLDANGQISKGSLAFRFFIRNLTDRRAYINRVTLVDAVNSVPVEIMNDLLQPRTFGMGVSYAF
jgi:iron complex outermembrane recepter protein